MSGTIEPEIIRGFSGKVPARGDFVHGGLPRDFNDPWHDWQSTAIAGSRALMGEAWLDAFLEAPVWRFVFSAGLCGPRAAVGLIMPSVDKVGRYFPLTFAALPDSGTPDPADWAGWLDEAEALGRLALDEDAPPERLMPPPCPASSGLNGGVTSAWWTDGGPRVEATSLSLFSLPSAACFASMLGHLAPTESAS
ncbi:MAG: type VI secretion system-associated protein TagF [Acetobacteraceae bacterium]|nr:type VI secretion system-associated protein TagF [Acetobacteraceae bacterium]